MMHYTDWCTVCEFINREKNEVKRERERERERIQTHIYTSTKNSLMASSLTEQQFWYYSISNFLSMNIFKNIVKLSYIP